MGKPWLEVARALAGRVTAPTTLGICGPQGSGKSTLAATLARVLEARGIRTAILSLDDLYLPRAARMARHPLFAVRGPPGTHDTDLGRAVLRDLHHGSTRVPRFDKPTESRTWETLAGPFDVVLFEGWCVGARPQAPEALSAPINSFEAHEDADGSWRRTANDWLAGPYQELFGALDRLVLLAPPGFEVVVRWRSEQEAVLGDRRAMTDPEIEAFVARYERLTRWILEEMPARADVVLRLDAWRALQDSNLQPPA